MKVILEASALLYPKTGIGRYTWELAQGLRTTELVSSVRFYAQGKIFNSLETLAELKPRASYPLWSKPWRVSRSAYLDMRAKYVCDHSVVHGPNYFLPACAEEGIITIHDLSIYRYPETHPVERVKLFEKNFNNTLSRTQHIITDSEAMKHEIIELLGWAENKISVVLLGVAQEFTPRLYDYYDFLTRYGLAAEGYSLCVATIEPRKNIDKLLTAYKVLPKKLRGRFPLVIIGGIGWNSDVIIAQIEEGVREGWIIRPGFISDEELVLFYQHAKLFIYPSAYEGFGLPVTEAMACGVPVIISNRTSLPEVANGAALIIEPDNHEEFVSALHKGLEDEEWQLKAIADGIEKAKRYTWERCVDETVRTYSKFG